MYVGANLHEINILHNYIVRNISVREVTQVSLGYGYCL